MDLMREFEEYLPRWSDEKHLPIPTKKHMDRWYRAWNDFVKEELNPRWDSIREEYKSLRLYNSEEPEEIEEEPIEVEPVEVEEPPVEPKNSWDAIQEMMKKLQ